MRHKQGDCWPGGGFGSEGGRFGQTAELDRGVFVEGHWFGAVLLYSGRKRTNT